MKRSMKLAVRKLTLICIPGFVLFAACSKDDNNPPVNPPANPTALQAYISGDTSLSIYNAAITKAGAQSLYAGSDSVTVLIPTNNAFRTAGITANSINNMSANALDSLLQYHFINQAADLTAGTYNSYTSKLGTRLYGYGGGADSNYFNGSQAVRTTIPGSNAVVYKLKSPLAIPYANGTSYLNSDTSLSFFSEALIRGGVDLSADTGFTTVLAPTNDAFRAAGYSSLESIDNADSLTLRNTLMYHVLPGQYFTNSYNGITTVPTSVSGNNITIGSNSQGVTFTGTGNSAGVGFAGQNQLVGTNTVYQPINGVLMP